MPSDIASVPCNEKRELYVEEEPTTESSPLLTTKRRKRERPQRFRTPASFWDNLSRLWLTSRALREFDRRTVWPATPVTLECTGEEEIDLAQLKRFARHGGPSLNNLRGYAESGTLDATNRSTSLGPGQSGISMVKRSSAYEENFGQHLEDHGVYHHDYDAPKPHNYEEIRARLALRRASLSPSRFTDEAFWDFKMKVKDAFSYENRKDKGKVISSILPIFAGTADISSQANTQFENLEDLTDGSITAAQPDFWDGSRPEELNQHFREKLGPYIVPSTNTSAPCLPNFFTEVNGRGDFYCVGERQTLYSGALGARGIHELRSYIGQETLYDNKAYTIAIHYKGDADFLEFYSILPIPSTNSNRKYEFRLTRLTIMDNGNPDSFRDGATAFRNARDWAKEKREELIAAANSKVSNTEHPDLLLTTS